MQAHNEILRTIVGNCASLGITEDLVYRQAGIAKELIAEPDGMQDWKLGVRLWQSVLELSSYRLIGLSFGKNITPSVLGWIGPLTLSSPDLKRVWKSFTEFFPLMGDMFAYYYEDLPDGAVKIIYRPQQTWVESDSLSAMLATEHAMSLTLSLSGYLSGQQVRPSLTTFAYEVDKKHKPVYKEFFGTNVLFAQDENALVFDAAVAKQAIISANPVTYENMLKMCSDKMRELEEQETYEHKVLQALGNKQSYYFPKINEIAGILNVSVRTLQRKLKEENKTYQQLVENYQVELALQLLTRPSIQVKEVAFILGFTSLQSFSRAFKRNTGYNPSQYQLKNIRA